MLTALVRRQGFGERRGLTMARPPGLLQLTLDPFEFPAEPFALTLQSIAVAPARSARSRSCSMSRRSRSSDSGKKYKYEFWIG